VPEQRTLAMYNSQFNISVGNIQLIYASVEKDKEIILQTVDTIDNTIESTKEYIVSINTEKVNIESYIAKINYIFTNSLKRVLVASKNNLYTKINKYNTYIKNIRYLLETLTLDTTYKNNILESLNSYESESNDIYNGVDANNNLVSLQAQSGRIDELESMSKEINSTLETYELLAPPAAVVVEPPAPQEPLLAPQEPLLAPQEPLLAPQEPLLAPQEPLLARQEETVVGGLEEMLTDIPEDQNILQFGGKKKRWATRRKAKKAKSTRR